MLFCLIFFVEMGGFFYSNFSYLSLVNGYKAGTGHAFIQAACEGSTSVSSGGISVAPAYFQLTCIVAKARFLLEHEYSPFPR